MVAAGPPGPASSTSSRHRRRPGDLGHDAHRPVRPDLAASGAAGAVRRRPVLQALRQHARADPRPTRRGSRTRWASSARCCPGWPGGWPRRRWSTGRCWRWSSAWPAAPRTGRPADFDATDPGQPDRDRGAHPAQRQQPRCERCCPCCASRPGRTRRFDGSPTFVFLGGLDFPPNRDGLTWFLRECRDAVLAAVPDFRLLVVGRAQPGPAAGGGRLGWPGAGRWAGSTTSTPCWLSAAGADLPAADRQRHQDQGPRGAGPGAAGRGHSARRARSGRRTGRRLPGRGRARPAWPGCWRGRPIPAKNAALSAGCLGLLATDVRVRPWSRRAYDEVLGLGTRSRRTAPGEPWSGCWPPA